MIIHNAKLPFKIPSALVFIFNVLTFGLSGPIWFLIQKEMLLNVFDLYNRRFYILIGLFILSLILSLSFHPLVLIVSVIIALIMAIQAETHVKILSIDRDIKSFNINQILLLIYRESYLQFRINEVHRILRLRANGKTDFWEPYRPFGAFLMIILPFLVLVLIFMLPRHIK